VSILFGTWNFDGKPIERAYLEKAKSILAPYNKDGCVGEIGTDIAILCFPFHTTKESHREMQPHSSLSGAVYAWDGRLDNGRELAAELPLGLRKGATNIEIVAAAHARWSTDCFPKLLGDWALIVWDPHRRSLTLARDFVGARHLYYSIDAGHVTWSSVLDPLVLLAGKDPAINLEYAAGCLGSFPAAHLTPYAGIQSVPPCAFVLLKEGNLTVQKYWDFASGKQIRYRTDSEYEEHFRAVFRESVRRRLNSDRPVLAELSGGMDSSSIVCMADALLASEDGLAPRLDTLSYYSDSEPNWDEWSYFTAVEEQRGRVGCHIHLGEQGLFKFTFDTDRFTSTPGSNQPADVRSQIADYVAASGTRVLLSGIGGDEVLGGMPTPMPELCDLLARVKFRTLARRLKLWALDRRKPWLHLLVSTGLCFLPPTRFSVGEIRKPAPWLNRRFRSDHRAALMGYPKRLRLLGPLPTFQENLNTLEVIRRRLAWTTLSSEPQREKRYPYLDRTLLEFLYAVPREQFVRPGQRRSLMRRAMQGIVPEAILTRKRKSFIDRAPRVAIAAEWKNLVRSDASMVCASLGLIDETLLLQTMNRARAGLRVPVIPLVRTLILECWLRHLADRGLFKAYDDLSIREKDSLGCGILEPERR
jgi:asparagine synthase (glutamine-hydrolysing)